MTDELSTLASGSEVQGGELRVEVSNAFFCNAFKP